jgi:hypothetical protein
MGVGARSRFSATTRKVLGFSPVVRLDLDAIQHQYDEARKRTEPHRCPWLYSAAAHIPDLLIALRAERKRTDFLLRRLVELAEASSPEEG